jgi:hypothetical protein
MTVQAVAEQVEAEGRFGVPSRPDSSRSRRTR